MMPRNRNESDPDVNSPIMYDHYDSDEKMPGKDRLRDIREPDGDEGQIRKPDIDEPYRSPKEDSNILPIDEPPHWDQETGDVDDARSTF